MKKEPKFGIHILFTDGSNPKLYYNLTASEAAEIVIQWSVHYILEPNKDCFLISSSSGGILNLIATLREDVGMSWPEYREVACSEV